MGTKVGQNWYRLIHYDIQRQQRRTNLISQSSDAVAAQRRCISKCVVKTSAGIITASVLRHCNWQRRVSQNVATWWKASLADFLSSFYFAHFFLLDLCSHWLTNKNTASGWFVTIISLRQLLWFFNANWRCNTENQHKYMATEKYY
jgi:hypothetical protein